MRKIAIIAVLFLAASLAHGAAPRLKQIYMDAGNGSKLLSGVRARATIVLPDSASPGTIPFNTVSGAVYGKGVVVDSSASGATGRVWIRLPLTDDIYPPGCSWDITYNFPGQEITVRVSGLTDTVTRCVQYVLGQAESCP